MNCVFTPILQRTRTTLRAPARAFLPVMLSALMSSLIPSQSLAVTENTRAAVGEITLMFGEAYIVQPNGEAVPASTGDQIHVNDTIETGSGGFVHIRFVDKELVTVRPYSMLEIESFEYDPQSPQNSSIKFHQEEGVVRYISGEGAKNAKQNFRLNTPIAAIGVRGTDFVVGASETSIRAMVNEGAIVVAPFSSMCSSDSLGPCSQDAIELSSLSRQILEMNTSTAGAITSLIPSAPQQTTQVLALAVTDATPAPAPTENKKEKSSEAVIYTDTVASRAVNIKLASPRPPREVAALEFTPDVALSDEALTTSSQLVWGRWGGTRLENERITVAYEVAKEGRVIGPGDYPLYVLFRTENGPQAVRPGLNVLKFNLTQAQAYYNAAGSTQMMDVLGGNLQMDFNQNRFATDLQLSHAATGKVEFRDGGLIFDGGYFSSVSDTQSMAGAVSLDGKEAAYFFNQILGTGTINGLTLWSSLPK